MRLAIACSITLAVALAATSAIAQVGPLDPTPALPSVVPPQYSQTIGRLTPREIIQQKAQEKAAQRQARIAAREWFGFSQARPKTNAVPFTGLYGPQFQSRLLGRPASLVGQRTVNR